MKQISVYTDGSYFIKDGVEKCGYGIYFPNNELPNIGRPFKHTPLTSQRAELYAIYKAIYYVMTSLDVDVINIYSDSEYSIKSMTLWMKNWKKKGWKLANGGDVKNLDIIKKLDKISSSYKGKITYTHVYSHTGFQDEKSLNNDEADKLAKIGALRS